MVKQEISNFDTVIFKKIIFTIIFLFILLFLGWYTFYLYSNLNLQNFIYFIITIFFLCFFGSIILPQLKNSEIFFISFIWPISFFIFNFKKINPTTLSIAFFIFFIFNFITFYLTKREENKTVELSFSKIFKNIWNFIFISLFILLATIFYFQFPEIREGKFFIPQSYFEKSFVFLNPFLKEIDKDFDYKKTIKEYILSKKINLLGLEISIPSNEFIKNVKEKFNIEIEEKDTLSEIIYLILKSKYESLPFNNRNILILAIFLIITFIYESLVVAFGIILSLIASLFFWFMNLIGILKIKTEPRGKERVSF